MSDGVVLIEGSRIADIRRSAPHGVHLENFDGCAILPGFVNAHVHLELTLLRGLLEDLSFFEWIRQLTRVKYEHLSLDDLRVSARLGALECLAAGVTTVGEVTDVGAGWEAMVAYGLRGVAYQEVFGPAEHLASEAIEKLTQKITALRASEEATRRVGVSPHAPYTVSKTLYEEVRDFAAKEDLPVALHLAESNAEGDFVRDGSGPFAEYWKLRDLPVTPRRMSPIAYVESLGLLNEHALVIHALDCSAADIRLLEQCGVGIAHCPKSNLKLGHRIAPLVEFLEAQIPTGLGTDSVASNNVIDMFEEMRTASFLQKTRYGDSRMIRASEALHMATLGGARCLGVDSQVGSLDIGKLADLTIVDLNDVALRPVYDPVQALVYSANRRNVVATFLGGDRVDPQPHAGLLQQAQRIANRLRKELAEQRSDV